MLRCLSYKDSSVFSPYFIASCASLFLICLVDGSTSRPKLSIPCKPKKGESASSSKTTVAGDFVLKLDENVSHGSFHYLASDRSEPHFSRGLNSEFFKSFGSHE